MIIIILSKMTNPSPVEQTTAVIQTSLKSTKPVGIGESEHNRPDQTILLHSHRNPEVVLEFSEAAAKDKFGERELFGSFAMKKIIGVSCGNKFDV